MTSRDEDLADRHPATTGLLQWFDFGHLPDHLQEVSRPVHDLAHEMVDQLPDGAELTTGLRKLLEAKDGFVRQAIGTTITREQGPWVAPNARDAVAGLELDRERAHRLANGVTCWCGAEHWRAGPVADGGDEVQR